MCITNDHGGQLVLSPPLMSSQSPPPEGQGTWGVCTSIQSVVWEIKAFKASAKRLGQLCVSSLRSRSGVKDRKTVIYVGVLRDRRGQRAETGFQE